MCRGVTRIRKILPVLGNCHDNAETESVFAKVKKKAGEPVDGACGYERFRSGRQYPVACQHDLVRLLAFPGTAYIHVHVPASRTNRL